MSRLRAVSIATFALILATVPAGAKDKDEAKVAPKIFQDVVDCRKIAADAERLACYDSKVASLESAQQSKQLYIADKEEVKKSRRGLFGLALPDLGIFGGDDEDEADEDVIKQIEAVIKSVRSSSTGYIFTLEDGAVWAQTEDRYPGITPKAGQKILIKRAAMGSYTGSVEGRPSFRIKRRID
jgi:hypothetical protein